MRAFGACAKRDVMPRMSGVTVPLFSIRTRSDWGIGQISDLPACASWFHQAGQRLVQVLPVQALAGGETSPYGALSAFAIDPVYVTIEHVPDLEETDVRAELGEAGLSRLAELRASPRVDYAGVRALKKAVLARAFERFRTRELARDTERARAFFDFVRHEEAWLGDFALYAALRASHENYGWSTWPAAERDRAPSILALAKAPRDDGGLGTRVLEHMYLQWLAHREWRAARDALRREGLRLMGDMPFVVGHESADVWAHRELFLSGVSLGAPPDDFAPEGQSWGLPAYDWDAMDRQDLAWLRARARHAATLFDCFRIDHIVGFFREWVRAEGERGRFVPEGEAAQRARGETVLRAIVESAGADAVIGEDLGVIPPFVRETMGRLAIPGYKVLPWERDERFMPRDPRGFPELSVATWSTHDTMPITSWWDALEGWERERLLALRGISPNLPEPARELALFELLLSARSELTLFLGAELLGDKSRINTPGLVNDENWTWRLPRPIEDLRQDAGLAERFSRIRELVVQSGR